jgi:uncharacterized protein
VTRPFIRGSVVLLCLAAGPAAAQSLPKLTGPVNDLAGVIDPDSARELDRQIRALQTASGDAVVVATVKTFAPYGSIEEYAVKLFEQAGVGQRKVDNGLLVVLALQERRVRIEVGYGLEEFVTDGFAGDTIRQFMLPQFRENRYGAGLLAGTSHLIQRIAERRGVSLPGAAVQEPAERPGGGVPTVVVVLIVLFVVVRIISRISSGPRGMSPFGRRRGPWSGWPGGIGSFGGGLGGGFGGFGGGGGGGFGGFGGGMSGGGGASGKW